MRSSSKTKQPTKSSSARVGTTTTTAVVDPTNGDQKQNNSNYSATTSKSSPFLINPIDGDFLQYKNVAGFSAPLNYKSSSSSSFAVSAPSVASAVTFNNNDDRANTRSLLNRRDNGKINKSDEQQRQQHDELSDSDDDMVMLAATGGGPTKSVISSSSGVAAAQNRSSSSNDNNNATATQHRPRQLSKFEQKRMQQASQRQKDNIVHSQTVRGVDFSGSAFRPSVKEIRFDDFTMEVDNTTSSYNGSSSAGKPKTYSTTVNFTNVSLAAASMRPDAVPREHADCFIVKFVPCGMVSPGMSCSAVITFAPKEMQDIDTSLSFTTSTGKLFVPVVCRVPRLGISVSTRRIDFDVVTVGTISEKHVTVRNSGSLSTSFMLQGELIDDLKSLKHPTVQEMISEKRAALKHRSQQAEDERLAKLETTNKLRRQVLDRERSLEPLLSAEEIAHAQQQHQQLLQLQQQQLGDTQQQQHQQQQPVGSVKRGTITTTGAVAAAVPAVGGGSGRGQKKSPETPTKRSASNAENSSTNQDESVLSNETQAKQQQQQQQQLLLLPLASSPLSSLVARKEETHSVFSLVETDTCDAGTIDDILHGEPVALRANSSVTIAIRFHPNRMMTMRDEVVHDQQQPCGCFDSSFFVSFEAADVDDVPVLVSAKTKDLPVLLEQPTDFVDLKCGYYGIQYRSEITLRNNNSNVSVRISPKVPSAWKDHVIFTPTTAVIQPQERFTFRIKIVVPEPDFSSSPPSTATSSATGMNTTTTTSPSSPSSSSVLFHILFELADQNLPLILFVSGRFCTSSLLVTPQVFAFGSMNENEFYSKRISVKNDGLLPRFVCVSDFPENVTVDPRTIVSLATQKKRAKQLEMMGSSYYNYNCDYSSCCGVVDSTTNNVNDNSANSSSNNNCNSSNKCNMIILPGETFEFDVAMRPPDAPAPGLTPAQEWTAVVTLRCDDDARIPISLSGSRRRPPLEFSTPFVLLPRCAVWDVVAVSVVLRNKTNTARSFCFANLHPKLGIRVAPVSGEIEKNSSTVVVVEFHAHGGIVETLPMLEADLRPSDTELAMAQSLIVASGVGGSPLADTRRSAVSSASLPSGNTKKDKNKGKEESEHLASQFAAIEDAKKRVVSYCEFVCNATKDELQQVQPWEQAPNDAQRVTRQLVQAGEPAVDLFLPASDFAASPSSFDSSLTSPSTRKMPLPFGSTTSLFNNSNNNDNTAANVVLPPCSSSSSSPSPPVTSVPLLTRTVVIPCHIQGWNSNTSNANNSSSSSSSWIGLSVRCTVIPPTILAESSTTNELLETKKQQQLKELQAKRQLHIEHQVAQQISGTGQQHQQQQADLKKPKTPRGGDSTQQQQLRQQQTAGTESAQTASSSVSSSSSSPSQSTMFQDSHVLVLFPPTASVTGKSTNSIKLSFASVLQNSTSCSSLSPAASPSRSYPSENIISTDASSINAINKSALQDQLLTTTSNSALPFLQQKQILNINDSSRLTTALPPKNKKVFISVTPLDPHGPFQLLVPPKTELHWPDLASTECTFSFRPKYSALYRVEGSIVISSPETGIIHQIRLRFEGQGLPTSFAVSTDKSSLYAEAVTAAEAVGYHLPLEVAAMMVASTSPNLASALRAGGGGGGGGRPNSGRGTKSESSANSPGVAGNRALSSRDEAFSGVTSSLANSMPVQSPRDVPALRLSLGNCIVGSSRAQETVYVLNRSTFPITCKFDVAPHRSCPAVDNGGVPPFAVEPSAVHLAPFAVGEATVSCSTLTSGTFLTAIRVTTSSEDKVGSNASEADPLHGAEVENVESETELFVSCNIWDYPVYALLPSSQDVPLQAAKLSSLIGSTSQASASTGASGGGSKAAAGGGSSNVKSSGYGGPNVNADNNDGDDEGEDEASKRGPALSPLWLLPPTFEKRLRELSTACPLELSVVSRKNKSLSRTRMEAFQALRFATAFASSPLLSAGGASAGPLISAAFSSGATAPSSSPTTTTTTTATTTATAQSVSNSLQLINSYNPYGRDIYFGQALQPGSCSEFPLVLNFVTTMRQVKSSTRHGETSQTATMVASVLAAEKTALTTDKSALLTSATATTASAEKSPPLLRSKGDKSSAAATLLAQGFSAAGAQAQMMQPVAPGVAHQIVVGFVKAQGSSLAYASTSTSSSGTSSSGVSGSNTTNAGALFGEFSVDSAILDPVAQRQGWRVDPPRGSFNGGNVSQRMVFSFTPTAALVNALPVPGVTVSSSIDVKLTLKYSNADAQTIFLKLVGQVKRE